MSAWAEKEGGWNGKEDIWLRNTSPRVLTVEETEPGALSLSIGEAVLCGEAPEFLVWNWKESWIFLCRMWKVYLVTCSSIRLPFLNSVPQIARGWSSPRCSCYCRRSLTCSCLRASSAHPGARTSCWRAPPPTAPPRGMPGKICAGKGWQSPPAKQHTWVGAFSLSPSLSLSRHKCIRVCICMHACVWI